MSRSFTEKIAELHGEKINRCKSGSIPRALCNGITVVASFKRREH